MSRFAAEQGAAVFATRRGHAADQFVHVGVVECVQADIVEKKERAGAAEVHLRICAPPIRYACHLGVDTAPENTLIANNHDVDEIRGIVGADSLGHLSLDGLVRAIGLPERDLCNACFHGHYPMPIEGVLEKFALEPTRP